MDKKRKVPAEIAWVLILVFLLVLTCWWIPGRGAAGRQDSLSASRAGKKLFYDVVTRLHADVARELDKLIPDPSVDTCLMLGPSRYPNRTDLEDLYRWVAEGHTLVFAARWNDPALDLSPFPVRICPYSSDGLFAEGLVPDLQPDSTKSLSTPAYPELETGNVVWRSQGFLDLSSYDADAEDRPFVLVDTGTIQAVAVPIGSGFLIACATDDPFTNNSVRDSSAALLAVRILESGIVVGPICFGEYLNRSGGPSGFRLLFDPDLRPFTLQILIGLVLFLWATARRFGPPEPELPPGRRATSEHARALGELYRHRKQGGHVLTRYLAYVRDQVGLNPRTDTLTLLEQAAHLAASPSLDNRSAAAMIRKLAQHFEPEQGN